MKKEFNLIVEPISVNSAYYARNKKYNEKAREYRAQFFNQLVTDKNIKALKELESYFNRKKHSLSVTFNWLVPHSIYYTAENYISRRSKDLDNLLKLPIDFLTAKKYNDEWLDKLKPSERELFTIKNLSNLGIDDQYINQINTSKSAHRLKHWQLHLVIEIKPLN